MVTAPSQITFFFFLLLSVFVSSAWAYDPAANRTVFTHTALPAEPGRTRLQITGLASLGGLEYGLSKNVELGVTIVNPMALFFGVGFSGRFQTPVSDKIHVGAFTEVGVVYCWFCDAIASDLIESNNSSNWVMEYFGGGPMVTFGDLDYSLTVSGLVYGGHAVGHTAAAFLPTIGGSVRLADFVKLNLEFMSINAPQANSVGKVYLINWAFRFILGREKRVFLEFGMMNPISHTSGFYKGVRSLGLPVINFGVN